MIPFYLKSITIGEQCSRALRKSLVPGTYKLADELPFDLYGKNISVSAIVGMNGAGKSTLLDILFRVINNLSFLLIGSASWRRASEPLYFIPGLYAVVEYEVDGKYCKIECAGNVTSIIQGTAKYYLTEDGQSKPAY